MGLGQTLLTIMALMLMGRLILSINTSVLDSGNAKDIAEYRIAATSLGTSLVEVVNARVYDQNTDGVDISSAASLSATLGRESGETTIDQFNDVDDFNGYTQIDTLPGSAIFKEFVTVQYATITMGQVVPTTTRTFNKLITVKVTSDYMADYSRDTLSNGRYPQDTLVFRSIFSYWAFR